MHSAEQIVLFVVFALTLGGVLRYALRGTGLPYTVLLLVAGLLLGVAGRAGWLGYLPIEEAVAGAATADPHVILLIFLPTLIFESAFSMDIHVFRRSLWQVTLLAVPGLLIAAAGAALIARLLLPGEWGWPAALMFGALISATDPVAVVALLKELGVSKRLSTLVEGESLFNDGTAIVVFLVFFGLVVDGGSVSASGTLISFVVTSAGGVAVGLLLAWGLLWWLRCIYNDALLEITLTVIAAYLTYYVAEHIHVSGVLAVVALGLAVAGGGRTRISPDVHGFLHHFWELAAYLANTVIFVMVGIVVAWTMPKAPDLAGVVRLLGLFVGLQLVRGVTVLILMPWLRRSGYGMSGHEALVLTWSGLRGAVGLALALVVAADGRIAPHIGSATLHYTAGIVVLSLLINGTTIRALLNGLGMMRVTPGEIRLRKVAAARLSSSAEQDRQVLREDRFLGGADWGRVAVWQPAPQPEIEGSDAFVGDEAMQRMFELEKRACWRQYNGGRLGPAAVIRLHENIDTNLDLLRNGRSMLDRWDPWVMPAWVSCLRRIPLAGAVTRRLASGRLSLMYDMARGAVVAQDELLHHLDDLAGDSKDKERLAAVCHQRRRAALNAIHTIHEHYPEIAVAVETACAQRLMLTGERATIEHLLHEGILDEAAAKAWIDGVEAELKKVWDREETHIPSLAEMLNHVQWLQALPESTFAAVAAICRERLFAAGENLLTEGEKDGRIIVVVRGSVTIVKGAAVNKPLDSLGPGAVIGEIGALTGAARTATARAETTVAAGVIEAAALAKVLKGSPELRDSLWRTAALRTAENLLRLEKPWSDWRLDMLRHRLQSGELVAWQADGTVYDANEGILITGEASTVDGVQLVAPALIQIRHARPKGACRLLVCRNLRERPE